MVCHASVPTMYAMKHFSLRSGAVIITILIVTYVLQAGLEDSPLGRDSALACSKRTAGDICGTAEPLERFAGLASVPSSDDKALVCSKAGFCEIEQVSRRPIDPAKYRLSFYNAYHSISRS